MGRLPRRLILCAFSLTLYLAGTTASADAFTRQLNDWIQNGDMQQAYRVALPELEARAGDVEFDFPFGVAAIDTGHVDQGLFALERVLALQPQHHRARLEYARGLFLLGQDALARQEFELVLKHADPPPAVQEKVEDFLQKIRQRESRYYTSTRAYVSLGGGHDSNLNSAPSHEVATVFGTLEPADQDDLFSQLAFGAQLYHPLSKRQRLFGRFDSSMRHYQDIHDQDTANYTLSLGSQWSFPRHRFSAGLTGQQYRVDDSRYRYLYGLDLSWSRALREQLNLESGFAWLELQYPDDLISWRDSRQAIANLRLHGVSQHFSWQSGLFIGDERADDQHDSRSLALADRRFYGLQLSAQRPLSNQLSLISSLVAQDSRYEGRDLLFGEVRDDFYAALDLGLKYLLDQHWQLSLNLNLSRNHSNIALYEYNRAQGSLSLRYDF